MAAIKYDVSDVEAGGGGEQAQPATYPGKIVSVTPRSKKADGTAVKDLEVVIDIGSEYARLWSYIKLPGDPSYDQSKWKLREFTDAIGLPEKGSLDPAKITKEQPAVLVKVAADTDKDGDYKARVKNLFRPGKTAETDDDDGNEAAYDEWELADLEAEIEARSLEMPTGRKTKEKLIDVLVEADAAAEEAEEPAEDEPEAEAEDAGDDSLPEGYEDIAEWEASDLKEELEKLGLKLTGRYSDQKAVDAIVEHVSANGASAEAEDGEPTDDYDEWPEDELSDEIQGRIDEGAEIKIVGRKTKDKMITALREDDANAEKAPF